MGGFANLKTIGAYSRFFFFHFASKNLTGGTVQLFLGIVIFLLTLFSVNNAGVGLVTILECMTMDQIHEMFDVNFYGAVRLIKAVLPGMKARQAGYIVNVSSIFGITGGPFSDMYTAAKFAVGGMTESLAPVLKQFNIK